MADDFKYINNKCLFEFVVKLVKQYFSLKAVINRFVGVSHRFFQKCSSLNEKFVYIISNMMTNFVVLRYFKPWAFNIFI